VEIRLLKNPKKVFSTGVNAGVREAKGDLIMILGTHSEYPADYVSSCVKNSGKAENVGGCIRSIPRGQGFISRIINLVRNDIFGCGRSEFRQGTDEPKYVVTVFGGCYKREVFERIGLFNEKLERSSDIEFNLRLKEAGMKTLLVPSIVVDYYARTSLWEFLKHNFKDGKWSLLMTRYSKVKFGMRRLIPALFVLFLPLTILPYSMLCLARVSQVAFSEHDWRYLFVMPFIFFGLHVSYGLGSLCAIPEYLGERGGDL